MWDLSSSAAAAVAKFLQSCPTLCDPIDGSLPGFLVPGIPQARTLQWVAISFNNAWKWKVKVKSLSHVQLFVTPWTAADQAPPPMGFSRQEYWSGVPLPSPAFAPSEPEILGNLQPDRKAHGGICALRTTRLLKYLCFLKKPAAYHFLMGRPLTVQF